MTCTIYRALDMLIIQQKEVSASVKKILYDKKKYLPVIRKKEVSAADTSFFQITTIT